MLLTRVSVALALVTAGLLALDCADGGVIDPQGGGGTTSSTGQGGTGGLGGAGVGGDGQGGDSLCEQDCSTVDPPDCYISVCNEGAYPGEIGKCTVVPDVDGTSCDDGLFCTVDDTCQAGICTGGGLNDCGMTPPTCQAITCDEISGTCATEPADEGMACTSDDLCQVGTTCSNGVCGGGTLNDCLFAPVPNMCHVAVCNPMNGMCEPEPGNEGQGCTDPMDPCTVNKTCATGVCQGGQPKDCSNLTMGCNLGVCDTTNGQCMAMAVGDGQLCDDLDGCTLGEICSSGVCGGGTPNTTCSMTQDGCCPSNCDATTDIDCACPGVQINGTCVYLQDPTGNYSLAQAQNVCQSMGTGWDLCSPSFLCNSQVFSYLAGEGCDCTGGATTCSCGSASNLYVHVTGGTSPYYIRAPEVPNCGSAACTNSVSASCGVALCCK